MFNINWGKSGEYLKSSCLALAVFLMAFVFVPYIVSDANAESANLSVAWLPVTLELNTGANNSDNGDVAFNGGSAIVPRASEDSNFHGTLATTKRVLEVNTSAKYFKVFLSMASDATTQNLCYVNPSNSSELLCDTGATAGISPINATPESPLAFSGTAWGFAIGDNNAISGYNFSTADSYKVFSGATELNDAVTTDVNETVYTSKFAAVPAYNSEKVIWNASTNNANGFGGTNGDQSNTKNVYYGVMVGTDLISGTYRNNILYTAIASASSLDTVSSNMVVNTVNAARSTGENVGGPTDLVRLDMDLTTDNLPLNTSNVAVKVYKHSDINSSTKQPNSGATAVGDCTLKSVEIDSTNNNLVVKCEMPGIDTSNNKFGLTTLEGVGVDFIVTATPNGSQTVKYSSYSGSTGKFIYAGLQTRIGGNGTATNAHYVQNMQQMSAGVCKMTNMWPNQVQHIGGTGSGYTGGNLNGSVAVAKRWTDSDNGSYKLGDSRDGKAYLVRRLADGNCWMVQNLDLDLFADVELSSSNTDLGYDTDSKEYATKTWTPETGLGNDSAGDNIDNSDWGTEKAFTNIKLVGYNGSGTATYNSTVCTGDKYSPCFVKSTATGSYTLYKIDGGSAEKASLTTTYGTCSESSYPGGCKVVTTEPSGSKNYTITQFGNMYGYNASSLNDGAGMTSTGDWRWDQTGADGAHVYDQGPLIYSNSFSGTSGSESVSNSTYNICTQSANGTTVYAVSANNTSGSLKDKNGTTVNFTTCQYVSSYNNNTGKDADGRKSAADSGFAGNWYNWYAATAGTGTAEMTSGDAPDSVCPRGWRLPSYDGNYSFQNLLVTNYQLTPGSSLTNADTPLLSLPLSYIRSGNYIYSNDWGTIVDRNNLNTIWSSRLGAHTYSFIMRSTFNSFIDKNGSTKGHGFSVRCVAR